MLQADEPKASRPLSLLEFSIRSASQAYGRECVLRVLLRHPLRALRGVLAYALTGATSPRAPCWHPERRPTCLSSSTPWPRGAVSSTCQVAHTMPTQTTSTVRFDPAPF